MSQHIFLVRHGETEWSRTGQHTGRTDIALTEHGRAQAERIGQTLPGKQVSAWTSPLIRARETAKLAGVENAQVDNDLIEWNYGIFESRTTADIRKEIPNWSVWDSLITGGESIEQVAGRAQRVLDRATQIEGDVALFAHGHILRILAACWIGQPPLFARHLGLDTATVSILGYERETRVIRRWNVTP
jgi:probable phosphoglycerate mutase